jgi:hypothetical protein
MLSSISDSCWELEASFSSCLHSKISARKFLLFFSQLGALFSHLDFYLILIQEVKNSHIPQFALKQNISTSINVLLLSDPFIGSSVKLLSL